MRKPLWEATAGALARLFNTRTDLVVFDLYTITLPGGVVLRWSGTDVAVAVNGQTWVLGPLFLRGRTNLSVGIQVDSLDVRLFADDTVKVAGVPLIQYIGRGGFDNARVQVDRAFKASDDLSAVGVLTFFTGRIADTKADRTQAWLTVKSDTELLDVMLPREVYQPGCANTLYDPACGVLRDEFTFTGSALAGFDPTRTMVNHQLSQAPGFFDLGVLKWTSGRNAGISRTVKAHASNRFVVLSPFPFAVEAGDRFEVYPGCDKTQATCRNKFSNLIRFRGHPYVPVPESVV